MERKFNKEKIAAQVSIALMAGMFSIVPVVYGAPVLDTAKDNTADVSVAGLTTNVIGTQTNNVVHWQDFSVATNETVQFDADKPTTARNYLNLVTGGKQSQIDGAIKGGGDVYIVNSQGVVFGKGASVDVGNLYVSTTNAIDSEKIAAFTAENNSINPLTDTAASAAADIVNMGKVKAASVYVEGGNIKFMNTEDIMATKVEANAQGTVRFDHKTGVDTSTFMAVTGTRNDYTLVSSLTEIANMDGRYALAGDINLSGVQTAIGTKSEDSEDPFTGAFDGNFYTITNYAAKDNQEYAGVFGYTKDATIENIGLINVFSRGTLMVGGVIGLADHTTVRNVYNQTSSRGVAATGSSSGVYVGGIIGRAINQTTIMNAYNMAKVQGLDGGKTGGIVGSLEESSLVNVYNTGTVLQKPSTAGDAGIAYTADENSSITNAYTTVGIILHKEDAAQDATKEATQVNTYVINNSSKKITSDSNGESVDKSATEKDNYKFWDNAAGKNEWTIYNDLPILRSFLTAKGTVSVNYTYTRDGETITHNSAEDTVWTYNGTTTAITATSSVGETKTLSQPICNKGTYSFFSSTQDGYDYIGNSIIVKPYQIKAGINKDTIIRKVYDGTADAESAVVNLFQGNTDDVFAADTGTVKMDFKPTDNPKFTEKTADGMKESPNAGVGKYVIVSGKVTLTGDTYGNYELVDCNDATKVGTDSLTITGTSENGIIEQRELRIELKTPSGINREYNGEEAVYDAKQTETEAFKPEKQIQISSTQSDDGGLVSVHTEATIGLTYADEAYYVDQNTDKTYTQTKMVGDHSVEYAGIKLNDTLGKNYKLVDAKNNTVIYSAKIDGLDDGTNISTGGALYGTGTIARKNIAASGFSINGTAQGAVKTYDNTEFYDDGTVGQTVYSDEVVQGDDLTFTVTKDAQGHYGYFTKSTTDTTHVTDSGENYGVAYHVTIGGTDAKNYQINGIDIESGDTKDVTGGNGKIEKRVITLELGDKTTDIDKTYDGNAAVKVTHNNALTNEISLDDGLVKYADGSNQLISSDGTKLSITGAYDSRDVKKSNEYGVGADQGITYTITVVDDTINGKAANYVFQTKEGASSQTITGAAGAINPVHIKDIQFAEVHKDYDKSDKVKGAQEHDKITIEDITDGTSSVLVSGEALTDIFNTNLIDGTYGSGNTDDTFTANAHVQRDPDTKDVISGTVKYTGKDDTSLRDSIITNNYVLDEDRAYYGKGTIKPLTITALTLAQTKEITKAYDGNASVAYTDVNGNTHEAADFVGTLSTEVGGESFDLTDKYSVHTAEYDSKDVAWDGNDVTTQKVTYLLNVAEDGDYAIADSLKDTTNTYVQIEYTGAEGGTITPRKLKAQAAADFSKTYDGMNVIYDGATPLSGNGVVTFSGYDKAEYGLVDDDLNANTSTAVYDDVNAGDNKTINYTAKIGTGTDTTAKNYEIYVDDGHGNWTTGTSFTKNNGTINQAGLYVTFDDVEKYYDGNRYLLDKNNQSLIKPNYHNGIKTRGTVLDDVRVNFASNEDSLFDSADVSRDSNGQVQAQNVTYKFTLVGDTADNYFIADANGNEVTTKEGLKTVINGRGTIKPKELHDEDVVINFDSSINKVYDTSSSVTYNHSEAEFGSQAGAQNAADSIKTFTIDGVVLKDKDAQKDTINTYYTATGIYLDATDNETSGVDANKARFTISLTDDAVSNFDLHLVSFYDSNYKTLTKTSDAGSATISPKNVTVSFTDPTVTKVYNGKTDVVTGSTQQNPDGTGSMVIGTDILDVSGIISGDTAYLDRDNINARYADKNVAYDTNGEVTAKNVYYDAVLKGDNAKNYKLVYGSQESALNTDGKPALTLTGQGTITPKEIAADFAYDGNVAADVYNTKAGDTTANKAYDATDTVNSLESVTISGVNGELIKLNDGDIKGTYGKWTADASGTLTGIGAVGQTEKGTFEANGDVNWLGTGNTEDEKTGYKAVKYTNLQNALAHATDPNNTTGFSGKNYTIANTVYFTEAAQKGKIRQLAVTANQVHERWNAPITKEYDGDSDVLNPEQYLTIYTDVTGSEVDLKYNLTSAVYDDNQVDVVAAHGVTYTLNDLQAQEFNNFKMDNDLLAKYHGKEFKSQTNDTEPTDKSIMPSGSITPRVLTITMTPSSGYDKIYDGGTDVKDANGNKIEEFAYAFDMGDKTAILEQDKDTTKVNLIVTGAYDDADANLTPEGETISGKTDKKTIHYTASLSGDKAYNYKMADTDLTGEGTIKQRTVFAAFDADGGKDIDRAYNGTADTSADADKNQRDNHIQLVDAVAGGNTGLLTGDKDNVSLVKGDIQANYAQDGNVVRDEQTKRVLTKDVYFTNFNLQGTNSGNYAVRVDDANNPTTLVGKGTINPMAVTVKLNNAPSKEYDGNTKIEAADTAKANFTITPVKVITNDDVANDIDITGYYQGLAEEVANAGTGKDYIYNLTLNNGNYQLADDVDNGHTVVADNYGMTATLTGDDGIITPRKVSIKSIADMTKPYDGKMDADTDYMNNLEKNIIFDRVVNDESLQLTGTAVYKGTDPSASSSDNDAEPTPRKVQYTITIGNSN